MTEVVVGKKLAAPPQKQANFVSAPLSEQAHHFKVQKQFIQNQSNSFQKHSSSLSEDANLVSVKVPIFTESCAQYLSSKDKLIFEHNNTSVSSHNSEADSQALTVCSETLTENCNATRSLLLSIPHSVASNPTLQFDNDALIDEVTFCNPCDETGTSSVALDESDNPSNYDEEPILDTDTSIGKSVALLMGKHVSRHKNIFDLMASAASSLIKNTLGKKKLLSSLHLSDSPEEKTEIHLDTAAHVSNESSSFCSPATDSLPFSSPITLDTDCSILSERPPLLANEAENSKALRSETQSVTEERRSCILPPIILKKHRQFATLPPTLQNHTIKETMKLRFESFRLGEGRFTFDDIAFKTKGQLIEQIRQMGHKSELKELQRQSDSKLREVLREILDNASREIKCKGKDTVPFFRIEHILSKRIPVAKSPSPETIKKWHDAAKKAGVPVEAFSKQQHSKAICDEDNSGIFSDCEPACLSNSETPIIREFRYRPRIVNAENMELLLAQISPPKRNVLPKFNVTVHVPSRVAQSDILWKKLCPHY